MGRGQPLDGQGTTIKRAGDSHEMVGQCSTIRWSAENH